jgi:hypothetical protein
LIPMATRSSTRHKLIWFSPQLVGAVVRNLLSIWDACWPMSVFSAASFPAIWLSRNRSDGNMIMLMHIGHQHHHVGS